MKSISTLILLASCVSIGLKAQMPVTLTDDSLKIGKTNLPSISVTIPEVNYENTLKVWVKGLESANKAKVVTDNNEMTIFGAKIKDVSPDPINVYSKMIKLDSMVQLKVAFELKKDQYVDRTGTPAEFSKAENFLKQFAKDQYIELVKAQVDAEDKKLRGIEKELSSLEKEKTKMQKSIQSNTTEIANEKENITVQNNELTTVSAAIVEHNKQLSSMSEGKDKDEKIKYLKDLDKRKKKAQSSIESSENKINKLNNDTEKTNSEIPKNEKMQDQVNEKIQNQQAVLGKLNDKLKKIKSY
jgi:hypothetical protein